LKVALAFLTVVPVKLGEDECSEADLAASRLAFPVVGALIGLALAALSWVLSRQAAGPGIAAFLLVAAGVALTGGLHLDGLADTADGLFLGGGRERRLAAMRDPHVGSFGVAAVVLVLLGKYAVLCDLGSRTRMVGILGAAIVSRSLILVSAGMANYARAEGTGRILIDATTLRDAVRAAIVALVAGAIVLGPGGLVAAAVAIGLAALLSRIATDRLGGVTGDTLGALVEMGELLFLLVLSLMTVRP
jgi:adenosylcobinamide-GDP ribazoletransferase